MSKYVENKYLTPIKDADKAGLDILKNTDERAEESYEFLTSRLRLLGLGFAHAYTEKSWSEFSTFLTDTSKAAGEAMLDSVDALNGIGHWPAQTPKQATDDGASNGAT
jgi:hypothetical protein